MKVYLTKSNIMEILCKHFKIDFVETKNGEIVPLDDRLFWEGNEERENNR